MYIKIIQKIFPILRAMRRHDSREKVNGTGELSWNSDMSGLSDNCRGGRFEIVDLELLV